MRIVFEQVDAVERTSSGKVRVVISNLDPTDTASAGTLNG
jgi:hypothetical protein